MVEIATEGRQDLEFVTAELSPEVAENLSKLHLDGDEAQDLRDKLATFDQGELAEVTEMITHATRVIFYEIGDDISLVLRPLTTKAVTSRLFSAEDLLDTAQLFLDLYSDFSNDDYVGPYENYFDKYTEASQRALSLLRTDLGSDLINIEKILQGKGLHGLEEIVVLKDRIVSSKDLGDATEAYLAVADLESSHERANLFEQLNETLSESAPEDLSLTEALAIIRDLGKALDVQETFGFLTTFLEERSAAEKERFFKLAAEAQVKGVAPEFILGFYDRLPNANFTDREGLAMFGDDLAQEGWLKYCLSLWSGDNATSAMVSLEIKNQASFFNEFFATNLNGVSGDLGDTVSGVMKDFEGTLETLLAEKKYELLKAVQENIEQGRSCIAQLDLEYASDIADEVNFTTHTFESLKNDVNLLLNANELLPNAVKAALPLLTRELPQNPDLGRYFLTRLPDFYKEPWAGDLVKSLVKSPAGAQLYFDVHKVTVGGWVEAPWDDEVYLTAFATVTEAREAVEATSSQAEVGKVSKQLNLNVNPDFDYSSDDKQEDRGFSDKNPFKENKYGLTQQESEMADFLLSFLEGRLTIDLKSKEGFILPEISGVINSSTEDLLEMLKGSHLVSAADKLVLTDPENSPIQMNSLVYITRRLTARYLAQVCGGDVSELYAVETGNDHLLKKLTQVLEASNDFYLSVYAVDIPLYDKLYAEFDELRKTGRSPLEVYLGRDGIFAYIGRKALDAARFSDLSVEARQKLTTAGAAIKINPLYLVYPSKFRDDLLPEVKREYLNYKGVKEETDAYFYDTGFQGSVPEQIMNLMGFSRDEIDSRIRLLSAKNAYDKRRRLRGLPGDEDNAVYTIESYPQDEHTASGLLRDVDTGSIKHYAKPQDPVEQLQFSMIKQALARHYWIQEKLGSTKPTVTTIASEVEAKEAT